MQHTDTFESQEQLMMNYPVYCLTGGTEGQRRLFCKRLVAALDRCQVCVKIIRHDIPKIYSILSFVKQFDLILIDRPVGFPVRNILLRDVEDSGASQLQWSGGNDLAMESFVEKIVAELGEMVVKIPVWACVLIGGKSSRMGRPKHLLPYLQDDVIGVQEDISWFERTVELLKPMVDGVVVSGRGVIPGKYSSLRRLADIDGVFGPLGGLLAATRWNPLVTWLVVACDMPLISCKAITWLMSGRRAGSWGRVPRLADSEYCEPLFAIYDFRAAQLFEEQLVARKMRVGEVAKHLKIDNPIIPDSLGAAWQNINTPSQLMSLAEK